MTDTQKDELRKELLNELENLEYDLIFGRKKLAGISGDFIDSVITKIEEAEKRGRENISIGVLQSIENLYKLLSPEPIFPSSPINQFIRELQDLVLKSNLTDK